MAANTRLSGANFFAFTSYFLLSQAFYPVFFDFLLSAR